jgi:hypothetical protein
MPFDCLPDKIKDYYCKCNLGNKCNQMRTLLGLHSVTLHNLFSSNFNILILVGALLFQNLLSSCYSSIIVIPIPVICGVQSGKQCLCSYSLPAEFGKGIFSSYELNSEVTNLYSNLKITSIADAVEGRVNVACNNGLVCCPYTPGLRQPY